MSKRILLTGCGSGIGRAAARELIGRGHEVVVTDRAEGNVADLAGPDGQEPAARFQLDVTVPADITRVREAAGPVDVLVNNAGMGLLLPVELAEVDLVRRAFEVNVLGALAMSQAFLPAMRERRSGRIVAVSSVAARRVRPMTGIYGATKHALEAMLEALRYEVRLFGVDVVVVEPGWVDTDFGRNRLGAGVKVGAPYDVIVRRARRFAEDAGATPQPVREVAAAIADVVEADTPPFRWPTSAGASSMIDQRRVLTDEAYEASVMRILCPDEPRR